MVGQLQVRSNPGDFTKATFREMLQFIGNCSCSLQDRSRRGQKRDFGGVIYHYQMPLVRCCTRSNDKGLTADHITQ